MAEICVHTRRCCAEVFCGYAGLQKIQHFKQERKGLLLCDVGNCDFIQHPHRFLDFNGAFLAKYLSPEDVFNQAVLDAMFMQNVVSVPLHYLVKRVFATLELANDCNLHEQLFDKTHSDLYDLVYDSAMEVITKLLERDEL